jgi:hypothetical protein
VRLAHVDLPLKADRHPSARVLRGSHALRALREHVDQIAETV